MTNRTTKRKQNANYQRELRAKRDRLKQCRVCGDKAVVSERTGRLTKACRRHLGCDVTRKIPYVLPFLAGQQPHSPGYRPHRGSVTLEDWYPLDWLEHIL